VAGGTAGHAEAFTGAWMLLYAALHILDSVEDHDEADENWAQWGTGPAINISTALIAAAGATLETLEASEVDPTRAGAIRSRFFQTLMWMTAGQHADLIQHEPDLDACWSIIEQKSAPFFALACWAGARLTTADTCQLERFAQFGHCLGVLVQLSDDLDGLVQRAGTGGDLRTWPRWTLPVAYAMGVLDPAERDELRTCLHCAATNLGAETEARSRIIAAGAVLYLATEIRRYTHLAEAALLQAAPPSTARDDLLTLLDQAKPQLLRPVAYTG
jgi:geranylgeranyl pyrophosphate synthase